MFQSITEEISWLKRRIESNPKSMLQTRLAERYLQMNEVESAENICRQQLVDNELNANAHLILAKCYIKSNRYDEASRELKKVLELDPHSLQAYKLDSELKEQIGLREEVIRDYERILSIDPLDREILNLVEAGQKATDQKYEPLMEEANFEESELDRDIETIPEQSAESDYLDVIDDETQSDLDEELDFAKDLQGDLVDTSEMDTLEEQIKTVESHLEESVTEDVLADQDEEYDSSQIDEELNAGIIDGEEADFDIDEPVMKTASKPGFERPKTIEESLSPQEEEEVEAFETSAINEEAILPEIEDDLDLDVEKDELEEEESRFSEILDDIFAPTLDEEERRQEETRSALEKVAVREGGIAAEPAEEREEPVVEAKEAAPETEVEEKVLQQPLPGEDQELFEELNPFEDDDEGRNETAAGDEAEYDSIELGDEFETEDQFVDFLSSVDQGPAEPGESEVKKPPAEPVKQEEPSHPEEPEKPDSSDIWERYRPGAERPKDKFVTPTLGEIYAAQGQYGKAIHVFELLLEKHPDNEWYISKLEDLKEKLRKQKEN